MKYYEPKDFKEPYPVVPKGVTYEDLVKEVIEEYRLLPNNKLPSREMAGEIVELRIMAYQEGGGWLFKDTKYQYGGYHESSSAPLKNHPQK